MTDVILPPAVIGVFGSGQLGRMLAMAAKSMGYRLHTYSPEQNSPTGQVADQEICAPYDDIAAVRAFVRGVDVVTFEFENVPAHVARVAAEEGVPVRPGGEVLHVTQNRLREKSFLVEHGLPVTPFAPIHSEADLARGVEQLGLPAILKTAAFGYDGKGQVKLTRPDEVGAAWQAIGGQPAILEAFVPFKQEISVVAARSVGGAFANYGAIENHHRNHILDISIAPARVPLAVAANAADLAQSVLETLDVVGVLCVEFFVTEKNQLLINELAPRPHNSGHLTVNNAITSQFEQQARAVCGLPLGCTDYLRPAVMVNLLGDLWQNGTPRWEAALALPGVKLHLYGKQDARLGRKMGHITALADSVDEAYQLAIAARGRLAVE
ncbi:MAG: 5-(carboxyamino)imidazole ribonucleotide synthase [Caldilineaceae bacterium]|nr:5-(carboxyamino)imidazole ribonucleotide synthase [Caldilineaceae bacterium]